MQPNPKTDSGTTPCDAPDKNLEIYARRACASKGTHSAQLENFCLAFRSFQSARQVGYPLNMMAAAPGFKPFRKPFRRARIGIACRPHLHCGGSRKHEFDR